MTRKQSKASWTLAGIMPAHTTFEAREQSKNAAMKQCTLTRVRNTALLVQLCRRVENGGAAADQVQQTRRSQWQSDLTPQEVT